MKTNFKVLSIALLISTGAIAQTTETIPVKSSGCDENTVTASAAVPAAKEEARPSFCIYRITAVSGTCHNYSVNDIVCMPCTGTVCASLTSCTNRDCTITITSEAVNCTACIEHGHHAHNWTCQ